MLRAEVIRKLLATTGNAGLPVLLMKGLPLGYQIYVTPGQRPCSDIDLLVPPDQATRMLELVVNDGWNISGGTDNSRISQQFIATRKLDSGHFIDLDVHYRLDNQLAFANSFSFDELLARSANIPPLGENVRALGLADALLLACIHRNGHLANGDQERLVWLYDIHLILEQMDSALQKTVIELIREKSLENICKASISACEEAFGTRVPVELGRLLESIEVKPSSLNMDPVSKLWKGFSNQSDTRSRVSYLHQLFSLRRST